MNSFPMDKSYLIIVSMEAKEVNKERKEKVKGTNEAIPIKR